MLDKELKTTASGNCLAVHEEYNETVLAFANNIINPEGGTHVVGFRTGFTRTLNNYARKKGYLKEKDENLDRR